MTEIVKKILQGAEEAAHRIAHEAQAGDQPHPDGIFRVVDKHLSPETGAIQDPYWIHGLLAYADTHGRPYFIGFKARNDDTASSNNPEQARNWKVFNPYKPSLIIDLLHITPEELLAVTEGILHHLPYNLRILSEQKRAELLVRYRDSLTEVGDSLAETYLREQLRTNAFEALHFREAIEGAVAFALEKNRINASQPEEPKD